MKSKLQLSLFFFLIYTSFYAQTKDDVVEITRMYDKSLMEEKIVEFKTIERKRKLEALKKAKIEGWSEFYSDSLGNIKELIAITKDGFPLYQSTLNAAAALSTRTNHLHTGGSLGLDLNGQNMTARVWDGGTVRRTHNLFGGRVATVDDPVSTSNYIQHATHVTGTVIAGNNVASTKGMAFQANARTFNWTDDESEAVSEALLGMLVSNHSYGIPVTGNTGTLPTWFIGAYSSDARNWDEICFLAPYFLPVMSAGNDGNDNSNPNPLGFGYDKLTSNKTAKNVLIVANAQDASVATNGDLLSVQINSSSSQGPTDDNRIKPDVTGNGTSVLSASSANNSATATLTGTSMASPNVAGTLLLLQQHYKNLTNNFMLASTLRGLACHTADDAGLEGPDPIFGWGLLNAKKAAETLSNNGLNSWVSEENLSQADVFTKVVRASGNEPLVASITWTDRPGVANLGDLPENDSTPALVNNLDIRITDSQSQISYPWKLAAFPFFPAERNSDNNVDNVELIRIDNPSAGDYTITVTHKNNLVGGSQDYSLIVTGVTSNFSLISKSPDLELCANQTATYTFDYKQVGAFTTNFSAVNLPSGANVSFSPTSLSSNGTVIMTISNLGNVAPGLHSIGIKGDNGLETEIRTKKLLLYNSVFQNINLISPSNFQFGVAPSVILNWEEDLNAENYNIQLSTTNDFQSLIVNANVSTNTFSVTGLSSATDYYWRVTPSNRCGIGLPNNAIVYKFQTGEIVCGLSFSATDFSNANIATISNSSASVPIEVTGGFTIGDLNVILNISHTYIQDFSVTLTGPPAIGSPIVTLFDQPCGDNDDINCTLDDNGFPFTCSTISPAISGIVKPFSDLSNFNGLIADGTWILDVIDPFNGDGGSINSVTLSFCSLQLPLSLNEYDISNINIYPNPAKNIVNINMNDISANEVLFSLIDMQGRVVLEKKSINNNEVLNIDGFSDGLYILNIIADNFNTSRKLIIKR